MKHVLGIAIAATFALGAATAAADETAQVTPKKGELTMDTVRIALRVPRPNAAITVARVPLESSLARLKKPLVDRIAQAAEKEPF